MSDTHPDFLAAEPERQWKGGKLLQLAITARERAWKAKGEWVWWILPHGACVAMRVNPTTFRKELRISRRERPTDEKGWKAWRVEVATFVQYLECKDWTLQGQAEPDDNETSAWAVFLEPLAVKVEVPCARCGAMIAPEGKYREELCNACAMKAGAEEVAAARELRS